MELADLDARRLMLIRARLLHVHAGRDHCRHLDANLFIGLFPGEPEDRYSCIPYRWSIELARNWLPTVYRQPSGRCFATDHYPAYLWTGRRWHVIGWEWPIFCWSGFR